VPAGGLAVADDRGQVALTALAEALLRVQQMLGVQPGLDALGQLDFVGGVQQGRFADAVEIHAHEVSGRALSVQIAIDAACGGICHNGLLISSVCHELQRSSAVSSSRVSPASHVLISGFLPDDLRMD
jgi:hypothetical protein